MIKNNKLLIITMILALFTIKSVKSIHYFTRQNVCYHRWLCYYFVNMDYKRLYDVFNGMPHLQYQLALSVSYFVKSRGSMYGWYDRPLNDVFAPLIAFKTKPPYHGFNKHYSHIYRQLEEDPRMLESAEKPSEPADPFKIHEMNDCNSVASCKNKMCEATEHDFKNMKSHYDIIKLYYKMVMQAKYYQFTAKKENLEFFESSCFDKDYKGEKEVIYDSRSLSEGTLLDLHRQEAQNYDVLLEMYRIFDVPRPDDFDDAKENPLGSRTIDDVVDSSLPVPDNSENKDGDKILMEPVFNKNGDIVKMVETVF